MKLSLVILLVLASSPSAQELGSVARVEPKDTAPKGEVLEWTSAAGRPFWYRLPKKASKPNLVLMLHGTGGNHGWSFWNYPIANGAFRKDDIVVSPDGVTPGNGDTFNFTQNDADAQQLVDLIRLFRSRFEIDRVFVYGHSQGAFFSYWFAGRHPELVAGIVAHAGNLLANVEHPKSARENVAVAILHGRADAVVPVDCAFATHRALGELGYAKLKLEIVEGLTETTGHWPLPDRVARLLEWVEQTTTTSAASCLTAAEAELAKPTCDFIAVADLLRRAQPLLKKAGKDERETMQALFASLDAAVDARLRLELQHLGTRAADAKAKEPGAWAVLARRLARIGEGRDAFEKEAQAWAKRCAADTKTLGKIGKATSSGSAKSFAALVAALPRARCGDGFESLLGLAESWAANPPRGTAKDAEALRAWAAVVRAEEAQEVDSLPPHEVTSPPR